MRRLAGSTSHNGRKTHGDNRQKIVRIRYGSSNSTPEAKIKIMRCTVDPETIAFA